MLLGILILVLGFLLLIEVIFPTFNFGFWLYVSVTLFVCGLYKILKEEKLSFFNVFITVIGLLFTLINLNILPIFLVDAFVPILIILLGVTIIYNTSTFKKPYSNNSNIKRYNAIFSENKEKVEKINNSDIESYAIFGSITIDLDKLELTEDASLTVYSIFGESTIFVSDKYNVVTTSTAVLGENVKNVDTSEDKNKKTIYINCISILGGSKIRKHDKNNSR